MGARYIKQYSYEKTITNSVEVIVAKLYCLTLPIRMIYQLSFLKGIFGVCANYLPFVFHAIGLLLWFDNENGQIQIDRKNGLVKHAAGLLVYLNLSSLLMAFVIQAIYGDWGTESAFRGIAGMMVYFTQYLLMFLYNYRVFQLLPLDELNKLIHIDCLVLLGIGFFQVVVINGIGAGVYDRLNFFMILNESHKLGKLSLTGIEGSTAGCIIGTFVLPYLLSQIIYKSRFYLFEFFFWTIPLFFTHSSTAYILAAVDIVIFVILLILHSKDPLKGLVTLMITVIMIALVILTLRISGVMTNEITDSINYLLFEKASDMNNGSTVSRTIPLLVNWGAFKEFPLLGVGNGLQGYFYEKYVPEWTLRMAGSDARIFYARRYDGIGNGGIFIPSLLSGYGLVGCLLILIFILHCIKENRLNRPYIQNFYYMYIISGIAFIIMGFQGDAYGLYFAWFMLSVPFMAPMKEESN